MEDILNLISNVGFPIAICMYLLIRIEGKMENLSKAINELNETLIEVKTLEKLEKDKKA